VTPPLPSRDRIARYYDDLVARYGPDTRACDYGDPRSQEAKFRVLSEVGPLDGRSVLDVGCGQADFAGYLTERARDLTYTGIDISPRMIEVASERHPGLDLRLSDVLGEDPGRFDLVTANGIFYLLGDGAEEAMQALVARMYEVCNWAVAFNSLSGWATDQETGEFHADPLRTVAFCRTLTPRVVLRHDYHTRDFTIYMYRAE
jgi:SAM-dependent methyltransferase